jgi:hypothetical protein
MIKPNGMADDLCREAIPRVGGGVWRHPTSFAQMTRSGYCLSTWQCPGILSFPGPKRRGVNDWDRCGTLSHRLSTTVRTAGKRKPDTGIQANPATRGSTRVSRSERSLGSAHLEVFGNGRSAGCRGHADTATGHFTAWNR